ncbi:svkA, partial [Symbiodinium microadriaticum]
MLVSSRQKTSNHLTTEVRSNPTERYTLREKIGQGGFGYVYKAVDNITGELVAAKLINLDEAGDELEDVQQEVNIMSSSTCTQLTKYYASYLSGSQLWIVMEYLEAGSLADMLLDEGPLDVESVAYVMKELLLAVAYLHGERKIHRDIKAGNMLLSAAGNVKLADFGVTGQLTESVSKRQTKVGTPYWMAPEVITEVCYDSLADIWSVGITAIELCKGHPPYASNHHPMQAIFLIPKNPPPQLEGDFPSVLKNFVSSCLQKDPSNRSSAAALLRHPFIMEAASEPPVSLMQRIETHLSIVKDGSTIDRILDQESRSNSRRSMVNRTTDSGWDFDTTLKKGLSAGGSNNDSIASIPSHDDYGIIVMDSSSFA